MMAEMENVEAAFTGDGTQHLPLPVHPWVHAWLLSLDAECVCGCMQPTSDCLTITIICRCLHSRKRRSRPRTATRAGRWASWTLRVAQVGEPLPGGKRVGFVIP